MLNNTYKLNRFLTGIDFRESSMVINDKCNGIVKKGMVFNVAVGFTDLNNKSAKDDEGRKVAVYLGDLVFVNQVSKKEKVDFLTEL